MMSGLDTTAIYRREPTISEYGYISIYDCLLALAGTSLRGVPILSQDSSYIGLPVDADASRSLRNPNIEELVNQTLSLILNFLWIGT